MKDAVFWNVAPCRSCVKRRFGGTHRLHFQGTKIREQGTSVSRWLQTEGDVLKERITSIFRVEKSASEEPGARFLARGFSTLKMEAIRSSETSVHTRSSWRHIPEDGILNIQTVPHLFSYPSGSTFGSFTKEHHSSKTGIQRRYCRPQIAVRSLTNPVARTLIPYGKQTWH
jgi:hypothetical protein